MPGAIYLTAVTVCLRTDIQQNLNSSIALTDPPGIVKYSQHTIRSTPTTTRLFTSPFSVLVMVKTGKLNALPTSHQYPRRASSSVIRKAIKETMHAVIYASLFDSWASKQSRWTRVVPVPLWPQM